MMFDVSQIVGVMLLVGVLVGFCFCWKEWCFVVYIVDVKDVVILIEEVLEGYVMFFGDKDVIMVMDLEDMKEYINNFGCCGEGKMDMVDLWLCKQCLVVEGKVDEVMVFLFVIDCIMVDKDVDKFV